MKKNLIGLIWLLIWLAACSGNSVAPPTEMAPLLEPEISVVAEGLLGPLGLALLPNGALLIAEAGTGNNDDSAGLSLMLPGSKVGRLVSGLPSSKDSGDLAGLNAVAVTPNGEQILFGNFGQGHLWSLANPQQGLALPETPLTTADLTAVMLRLNNVSLTNPFDITFDEAGKAVVTDASGNGIAKETQEGTTRFIHRFAPLPDPTASSERVTIEAVPTGIERVGSEYYVTLTGGCPYPPGGGQLAAIDEARNQRPVVTNLNMPIDVAQGADGTVWLLEFAHFTADASCFSGEGYQSNSGRLSQLLPDGRLKVMLEELNFPGAMLPLADGSVYLSEVFTGRVIHVTFPLDWGVIVPQDDQTPAEMSGTVAQTATDPAPTDTTRLFDLQGHRGARGRRPENTLPAFEYALDLQVTTLELDLHLTRDGMVVISHDPLIGPNCRLDPAAEPPLPPDPQTYSGNEASLRISQLSLEQVKKYLCDLNPNPDRFPEQSAEIMPLAGANYTIPTLAELFQFTQDYAASQQKSTAQRQKAAAVRFNVETKRRPDQPEAIGDDFDGNTPGLFERRIVEVIEAFDLVERVTIQSFDHRSIKVIAQLNADIETVALTAGPAKPATLAAEINAAVWSPDQRFLTRELLTTAHEANLLVIPWTVNDPEQMRHFIDLGVDGLITDYPDILAAILQEQGLDY